MQLFLAADQDGSFHYWQRLIGNGGPGQNIERRKEGAAIEGIWERRARESQDTRAPEKLSFFERLRQDCSDRQRLLFFKRLSVLLGGGLPLLSCLQLLQKGGNRTVGGLCLRLERSLRRGLSLAQAMAAETDFFSPLAVALTAAGERSGALAGVWRELAQFYAKREEARQQLLQALLYPSFLLGAALLLLLFFLLYVLPALAQGYGALGTAPDAELASALALAVWLETHGAAILAGVGLLLAAAAFWRQRLELYLCRLPYVRGLHSSLLENRFCKLLALLLRSGVALTEAVPLAAQVLTEPSVRQAALLFAQALQRGMEIGRAAKLAVKLFSPLTQELIAAGAASGSLAVMLDEAAELGGQELAHKLQRLREAAGPLLLFLASALAAAVLCSMLRPLFNVFTALPG